MLTTGVQYYQGSPDAATTFNNSNRITHPAASEGLNFSVQDHEAAGIVSNTSTPSTVDYDTPSPSDMEDESESIDSDMQGSSFSYFPVEKRSYDSYEQAPRQQSDQYAQRETQGAHFQQYQQQEQQHQGLAGQIPDLIVLSCAVCTSPTVQLCEGCTDVGYCSREHQIKDWAKHSKDCRIELRSPVGAGSVQANTENDIHANVSSDRYTPGKVFEVDAILIPVDQSLPQLVKAAFAVEIDEQHVKIQHFERCFDDLLGKAAPWFEDGQLDEDIGRTQQPQQLITQPTTTYNTASPTFSLHCRPNGQANCCYEALLGNSDQNTRNNNLGLHFPGSLQNLMGQTSHAALARPGAPSTINTYSTADSSLQENKHLRGNGSYLILKHPSQTTFPQHKGTPVLDGTLADLKLVIPNLRQRLQQKNKMGLQGRPSQGLYPYPPPPVNHHPMTGISAGLGTNCSNVFSNINNVAPTMPSNGSHFYHS